MIYNNSEFSYKMNKDFNFKKKIFMNFWKLIDPEYEKYNFRLLNKKNFLDFLFSKTFRKSLEVNESFKKISLENVINRNFILYRFLKNMFNCDVKFIFQPILNWCKSETSQEKALSDYSDTFFKKRNKYLTKFIDENQKFIDTTKKISENNQIEFYDSNEYIKKKNR